MERLGPVAGGEMSDERGGGAPRAWRWGSTYSLCTRASAMARMFAISASRPRRTPLLTTRRRSSAEKSSASVSAMTPQLRVAKCARYCSTTLLAVFSSFRACERSSPKWTSAALTSSRRRRPSAVRRDQAKSTRDHSSLFPRESVPSMTRLATVRGSLSAMYCRHPIAGIGHEFPQLRDRRQVPGPNETRR